MRCYWIFERAAIGNPYRVPGTRSITTGKGEPKCRTKESMIFLDLAAWPGRLR